MNINIIILIIAGIIAVALGYWFGKKHSPKMANESEGEEKSGEKKISLIEKHGEEKKRNLEAILGLMESGNQPLTNNQVEQMLGIPESTVTRYFDELEKEGKVKQVGKTGRDVFYERV
jgi:Fic family protein